MSNLTSTVLKALGVFGGVQGLNILAGVVRTKCAALWIGPEGVGLMSLFVQTIMTVSYLTQLSLRQSAVRDISLVAADPRSPRARLLALSARRLGLVLGLFGMFLTIALAPELSRWTFGSEDYANGFRILSLILLLTSFTAADNAILQSFNRLKALASANMWGSMLGTAVIVASLFFFRIDGIIPALIAIPFGAWLFSRLASRNVPGAPDTAPSFAQSLRAGKTMVVLGLYLTVSDVVTQLASYLFSIFLNREASTADVGIYQSGYTMVNYYVGMIFTAISMEYYPRLTAQIDYSRRTSTVVSHEMSVALWVLMPVIVLFVCFDELMVRILYSERFLAMLPFISLAIAGVVFRAISWCLAYVMLAKGDGRPFVVTEILSSLVMLALYTTLWKQLGFIGLGIAYILWYALYTAIVFFVYRRRYRLTLGRGIPALILFAAAVAIGASAMRLFLGPVITGVVFLPWLIPLCYFRLRKWLRK